MSDAESDLEVSHADSVFGEATCNFCNTVFSRFQLLRSHWEESHKSQIEKSSFWALASDERDGFLETAAAESPEDFLCPLARGWSGDLADNVTRFYSFAFCINEVGLEGVGTGYCEEVLSAVFGRVLERIKSVVGGDGSRRMTVTVMTDGHDQPARTPFLRPPDFSPATITDAIDSLSQRRPDLPITPADNIFLFVGTQLHQ